MKRYNRRDFLKTTLAASAANLAPFNIGKAGVSPNSKLNIAGIGVGGQEIAAVHGDRQTVGEADLVFVLPGLLLFLRLDRWEHFSLAGFYLAVMAWSLTREGLVIHRPNLELRTASTTEAIELAAADIDVLERRTQDDPNTQRLVIDLQRSTIQTPQQDASGQERRNSRDERDPEPVAQAGRKLRRSDCLDCRTGLRWLQRSDVRADRSAQCYVGCCYRDGTGASVD